MHNVSIKFCLLLSLLIGLLSFNAISQSGQDQRPNILWIVCEDIGPYLGAYGHPLVKTPHIDQLSSEGIRYMNAYTTAGVCAPSRSTIITGMYHTSIGTQHMRTAGNAETQPVPAYSAVIPPYVKCFPEYLRKAGYYCTNNEKQDYQFTPPVTVWDENSPAASWRNRSQGQPFFAVFNFAVTHEMNLFPEMQKPLTVDPQQVDIPAYYPKTKTAREGVAQLLTNIEIMDRQVGELLDMLKEDGLYENTYIFFYSDHGGALPWTKRELLDRGLHIPLIIRVPGGQYAGQVNEEMLSSVDFAPTVLSLAGISVPSYMQGQAFLGAQKAQHPRQFIFAGRDRMDTEYDRVRAVRDDRFKYIYNYMPEKPRYQDLAYRKSIPLMKEILALKELGELDTLTMTWFDTKPQEELYDTQNDPDEFHNLADDPEYQEKLVEMRAAFQVWRAMTGDKSDLPEDQMINSMWNGQGKAPQTAQPVVIETNKGLTLYCDTEGASIGYQIRRGNDAHKNLEHSIVSWDFGSLLNRVGKNGEIFASERPWKVYHQQPIVLNQGDTLMVKAMRIGYQEAATSYVKKSP